MAAAVRVAWDASAGGRLSAFFISARVRRCIWKKMRFVAHPHKHAYGFPTRPLNFVFPFDYIVLNLPDVRGATFRPDKPDLGVGSKSSKPPETGRVLKEASEQIWAGQARSLRIMCLGPITDTEQMPTCSRWTWTISGHPGSPWGALIRPFHLSLGVAKGGRGQEREHSSKFHPESGRVGGERHE